MGLHGLHDSYERTIIDCDGDIARVKEQKEKNSQNISPDRE